MKEILKELRVKNRYSQELLAKVLGLSRQAYMKYESGEVEPSVEIVRKLAKIYKVPYEVIIDNQISAVSDESKKNLYKKSHYDYGAVASAVPAYSTSPVFYGSNTNSGFAHFSQVLNQLQEMILALQNELNSMKINSENQKAGYSKSRSFDKSAFFEQIGTVNMDSSYINELREESLI